MAAAGDATKAGAIRLAIGASGGVNTRGDVEIVDGSPASPRGGDIVLRSGVRRWVISRVPFPGDSGSIGFPL